jgi:hypothetical protein
MYQLLVDEVAKAHIDDLHRAAARQRRARRYQKSNGGNRRGLGLALRQLLVR